MSDEEKVSSVSLITMGLEVVDGGGAEDTTTGCIGAGVVRTALVTLVEWVVPALEVGAEVVVPALEVEAKVSFSNALWCDSFTSSLCFLSSGSSFSSILLMALSRASECTGSDVIFFLQTGQSCCRFPFIHSLIHHSQNECEHGRVKVRMNNSWHMTHVNSSCMDTSILLLADLVFSVTASRSARSCSLAASSLFKASMLLSSLFFSLSSCSLANCICIVVASTPSHLSDLELSGAATSPKMACDIFCHADINECESDDSNNCHKNAQCTNTVGSFTCSCNPGYTGDGVDCMST